MNVGELIDRSGDHVHNIAAERAVQTIRLRRRRDTAFGPDRMPGPVWDVLLELFVYRSAGIDADREIIELTATPRFIRLMLDRGMIHRGARRDTLTLSDPTFAKMTAVLSA